MSEHTIIDFQSNWWSYLLAFIIVLLTSFMLEYLQTLKQKVYRIYTFSSNDPTTRIHNWKTIWKLKFYLTGLHVLTMSFHYSLMMVIMSLNLGLTISVLTGAAIGYCLFLEHPTNKEYISMMKETTTSTATDHCQTSPQTIILNYDRNEDHNSHHLHHHDHDSLHDSKDGEEDSILNLK
ncbi:hypothetical protein CYY_000259 [Polysphondylium violaceum]|uniref:Copper transport protein n=1 Tax=Polysphondylium violaceum TaxID=133409 RepID=A0A8J4V937_9MYCE|nr:hypothetical protein CYY_000259 [Polysphondylium violaceum]